MRYEAWPLKQKKMKSFSIDTGLWMDDDDSYISYNEVKLFNLTNQQWIGVLINEEAWLKNTNDHHFYLETLATTAQQLSLFFPLFIYTNKKSHVEKFTVQKLKKLFQNNHNSFRQLIRKKVVRKFLHKQQALTFIPSFQTFLTNDHNCQSHITESKQNAAQTLADIQKCLQAYCNRPYCLLDYQRLLTYYDTKLGYENFSDFYHDLQLPYTQSGMDEWIIHYLQDDTVLSRKKYQLDADIGASITPISTTEPLTNDNTSAIDDTNSDTTEVPILTTTPQPKQNSLTPLLFVIATMICIEIIYKNQQNKQDHTTTLNRKKRHKKKKKNKTMQEDSLMHQKDSLGRTAITVS